MANQELKYPYLPGLLLGADPVNAGAQVAENVEVAKIGELNKRSGFRRVNHRQYSGAIVCIPDLQRVCDYRKLLVCSAYPEIPGTPAPIFEHDERGGAGPEPFWDENYPPIACFTVTDLGGGTFRFDASCSWDPDGFIAGWTWDFGDTTGGAGESVEHTFAVGDYTVELTVADNEGKTGATTQPVSVPSGDPWVMEWEAPGAWGVNLFKWFVELGGTLYAIVGTAAAGTDRLMVRAADGTWSVAGTFPGAWTVPTNVFPPAVEHLGDIVMLVQAPGYQLARWDAGGGFVSELTLTGAGQKDRPLGIMGGDAIFYGSHQPAQDYVWRRTGVGVWASDGYAAGGNPPGINRRLFEWTNTHQMPREFAGPWQQGYFSNGAAPVVWNALAAGIGPARRAGDLGGILYTADTGGANNDLVSKNAIGNAFGVVTALPAGYNWTNVGVVSIGGQLWLDIRGVGGDLEVFSYNGAFTADRNFGAATTFGDMYGSGAGLHVGTNGTVQIWRRTV